MYSSVILFSTAVLLISLWFWKRNQSLRLLHRYGIPGPKASFFFGHIFDLQSQNVLSVNKWIKKHGKIIATFEGGPTVVVADPELVRLIQIKDFSLFPMRRQIFEKGGFDANTRYEVSVISQEIGFQRWKEQRALITTAFTSSKIRASVPLVSEGIDVLMDNIRKREEVEDFDIYDLFQRLTMDTIGRSAFGTNLNVQRNPDNKFFQATKRVFENASKSWSLMLAFLTIVFPELFYVFFPMRILQRKFLKMIGKPNHFTYQTDMCVDIIRKRKKENEMGIKAPDDFLQRLIDATVTTDQMSSLTDEKLAATADLDSLTELHQTSLRKSKVHRMNDDEVAANASSMI